MYKYVCIAAMVLFLATMANAQDELVVLTWEDYIDPDIIDAFEKRHHAKIRFVYFGDDDERDVMMINSNGVGYDLICLDEANVAVYQEHNWISSLKSPLDLNELNLSMLPASLDWHGDAAPYFSGSLGIVYRSDLIATPPRGWRDLFEPHSSLQGKILMLDTAQVLVGAGLLASGYDLNDTRAEPLRHAENLLQAQKPFVNAYRNFRLDENSKLVTGEIVAAMAYNGDALSLMDYHPALRFVIPKEGTSLWVDFFAVSSAARQPELAHAFLAYINEPAVAAQNAQYVHMASPIKASEALLPKSFLDNPFIYPTPESLDKSTYYSRWRPSVMKQVTNIYMRLIR